MENEYVTSTVRIWLAVVAGALIGLERTYHGRPAGFRTHTLVCSASSLLMLLTVFHSQTIPGTPLETVRIDPTRMAQGIMTGIGFLGAGVIQRERLTVRGLTTAASIWITAAIGIMIGAGLLFAALIAELVSLGALAVFRWIEDRVPTLRYARLRVRFAAETRVSEDALTDVIASHRITWSSPSYQLEDDMLQYELTVRTQDEVNFRRLAETLTDMENVRQFSILPTGS